MATIEYLAPTSCTTYGCTPSSGSASTNNYTFVDDATDGTHDSDTTYVKSFYYNTPSVTDIYGLGDLTATSGTCSVTVHAICGATWINSTKNVVNLGVNGSFAAIHSMVAGGGGSAYEDYSDTWANDPSTGLPWTIAAVNSLAISLYMIGTGQKGTYTKCSCLYVVVTVTAAEGGVLPIFAMNNIRKMKVR